MGGMRANGCADDCGGESRSESGSAGPSAEMGADELLVLVQRLPGSEGIRFLLMLAAMEINLEADDFKTFDGAPLDKEGFLRFASKVLPVDKLTGRLEPISSLPKVFRVSGPGSSDPSQAPANGARPKARIWGKKR